MSTQLLNTPSSVTLAPEVSDFCRRAVEALCAKLPVREVWLFGSQAEGTANEHSDVDLLVVLADGHGLERPMRSCFGVIDKIPGRPPVDVATINQSDWENPHYRNFGLWNDVATKGRRLL